MDVSLKRNSKRFVALFLAMIILFSSIVIPMEKAEASATATATVVASSGFPMVIVVSAVVLGSWYAWENKDDLLTVAGLTYERLSSGTKDILHTLTGNSDVSSGSISLPPAVVEEIVSVAGAINYTESYLPKVSLGDMPVYDYGSSGVTGVLASLGYSASRITIGDKTLEFVEFEEASGGYPAYYHLYVNGVQATEPFNILIGEESIRFFVSAGWTWQASEGKLPFFVMQHDADGDVYLQAYNYWNSVVNYGSTETITSFGALAPITLTQPVLKENVDFDKTRDVIIPGTLALGLSTVLTSDLTLTDNKVAVGVPGAGSGVITTGDAVTGSLLGSLFDSLLGWLERILEAIKAIPGLVLSGATDLYEMLKLLLDAIIEAILGISTSIGDALSKAIASVTDFVMSLDIVASIIDAIKQAVNTLTGAIANVIEAINPTVPPEAGNYNFLDFFKLLILLIIKMLALMLAFVAFVTTLMNIPADSSLLHPYMVIGLEWLKTYKITGFNLTFFQITTGLASILYVIKLGSIINGRMSKGFAGYDAKMEKIQFDIQREEERQLKATERELKREQDAISREAYELERRKGAEWTKETGMVEESIHEEAYNQAYKNYHDRKKGVEKYKGYKAGAPSLLDNDKGGDV